jgi:hypothetical protein
MTKMQWNQYSFARPISLLPSDLAAHGEDGLTDEQDELLTCVAGVAPGYPEVFTDTASRDSALGRYGRYVQFIETNLDVFEAAGWRVSSYAIGHRLGESGFNLLAREVVKAVAQQMISEDGPGTIIIARVRYNIFNVTGGGITIGAFPEFDVPVNQQQMEMTIRWLRAEFARQLAVPGVA